MLRRNGARTHSGRCRGFRHKLPVVCVAFGNLTLEQYLQSVALMQHEVRQAFALRDLESQAALAMPERPHPGTALRKQGVGHECAKRKD
jgi:hypothetical protein